MNPAPIRMDPDEYDTPDPDEYVAGKPTDWAHAIEKRAKRLLREAALRRMVRLIGEG